MYFYILSHFKRAFLGLWGAGLTLYLAIYGVWGRGMVCVMGFLNYFTFVLKNNKYICFDFYFSFLFSGPLTSLLCIRAGQYMYNHGKQQKTMDTTYTNLTKPHNKKTQKRPLRPATVCVECVHVFRGADGKNV